MFGLSRGDDDWLAGCRGVGSGEIMTQGTIRIGEGDIKRTLRAAVSEVSQGLESLGGRAMPGSCMALTVQGRCLSNSFEENHVTNRGQVFCPPCLTLWLVAIIGFARMGGFHFLLG
jgi:hypothetical protein